MRFAVLALQGAFAEHEEMLQRLGVETFQIRQLADWEQPKDGLVIPGGESTVQAKLLSDLHLLEPIRKAISEGLPVFGTCAGLILLSKKIEGEPATRISTMDTEVLRNAYGREDIPMTFIRAPYISKVSGDAEVLAEVGGHIVAARQGKQLVTSFHPELNEDTRVHAYFLSMI